MEYKVSKFEYNGFSVKVEQDLTNYTAKFDHWTEDPGIVACICSDGINRLIPSCCMVGFSVKNHPKQVYKDSPIMFGRPATSD